MLRFNLDEKLNTAGSVGSGNTFYFDYQGGEYGYNTSSARGADTFHPFKSGGGVMRRVVLGTATSYNIKTLYPDIYDSLTVDNFVIRATAVDYRLVDYDRRAVLTNNLTLSYNQSTGVVTRSGSTYTSWNSAYASTTVDIVMYYGSPIDTPIYAANSKTATIASSGNSYSFSLPGTIIGSIYAVEWFSNTGINNCNVSGGTVLDSHINSASGGWGGIIKATNTTISFSGSKNGTGGITVYACELV